MKESRNIVLYDGNCGFCDGTVQWLLRHDRHRQLYFTPLQSELAETLLKNVKLPEDLDSIVFVEEGSGRCSYYSSAILNIVGYLPAPWNVGVIAKVIPRFLRDIVYRWIARNRIRWFGTVDSCEWPTEEERSRFLL